MAGELEFAEFVRRWLRVRNGGDNDDPPFALDDNGFLPAPTAGAASYDTVALMRADDVIVDHGALVLLGEPGGGKTTTFSLLTGGDWRSEQPEPGSSGVVWITGSELSDAGAFTDALGEHLDALPRAGAAETPAARLTIVLDQLDEAANLFRLPQRLKRALRGKDTHALRLLIACRTADYPESLTPVLEQALGDCVVADLAPLTREDVATLAASTGVDAERFVAAVTDAGVGTLASAPLTLKILLAAFRQEANALNKTPRELFEMGVAHLADEPHPERAVDSFAITTVEERIVIAGRIATRMLLSGQRTIWRGEYARTGPDDITLGMLARGAETAAGPFEVSPQAVEETLKTGLFSRSGANRIAFAHSSFAAFLAARYLVAWCGEDPDRQRSIADVFLVAAPDEATASIPIHLRETAAWMLAHAPTGNQWLAAADPEGLIAHGAYITDFGTRAMMVDGLLRRAAEVELAERAWHRTWWRLTHPGLADQLRAALTRVLAAGSEEWQHFAAASLAIRFAHDCEVEGLCDLLLEVAETSAIATLLRCRAIRASMVTGPGEAVPRLRKLLASLATDDVSDETEELVGTIFSVLWPDSLSLADVRPHLHPVRNSSIIGMYRLHLRRIPGDVAEPDLPALLDYASGLVDQLLSRPAGSGTPESEAYFPDLSHDPTLEEALAPVFDRVSLSPNFEAHLPAFAHQVARLLRASASVPIPLGVDLVDKDGNSVGSSVEARRALAEAVILDFTAEVAEFAFYHAQLIVWEWRSLRNGTPVPQGLQAGDRVRLLDGRDFSWLLERADDYRARGADNQADAIGLVAAAVADLFDRPTFELVYARRDMPEGKPHGWVFEGVPVEGELAESMRRRARRETTWEHAEAFASRQRALLQSAVQGDTDAFWRLTRDLRADPATGHSSVSDTDDPRELPGASLWTPDDFLTAFSIAARQFVEAEDDHRDEWLGKQERDYRAEAGYAALIVLHATGGLDDIPDRWAAWVGVVLDKAYRAVSASDSPLLRDLMSRIGAYARDDLVAAIRALVRTALARGEAPWALTEIISLVPGGVYSDLVLLAHDLHAAIDEADSADSPFTFPDTAEARGAVAHTWAALLRVPLLAGDGDALMEAEGVLSGEAVGDDGAWTVAAGQLLLTSDPERFWPLIRETMTRSTAVSNELALACAQSYRLNGVADALSDVELVEVWRWLAEVRPPETDVVSSGWVPPERSIHEWRNEVLATLSRRGTRESVLGIRGLVDDFPADLRIQAALISARRRAQARATVSLKPQQVIDLLTGPGRRVIRTPLQLAELLLDVLKDIDADLPTHSNLLWDCERMPVPGSAKGTRRPLAWRPKREGTLAAYLAHEFALRLAGRAVVINREVVVKPTDAGDSGERPDLLVQAISIDGELDAAEVVSVPVEIKGSWHEAVLTAQRDQLANRYLPAEKTDAGVYVVGWYPIDLWTAQDSKPKSNAKKLKGSEALLEALSDQAAEIFDDQGRRTLPYVLTIARAAPTND